VPRATLGAMNSNDAQIASELECVPRGGVEQNELRMVFRARRASDLGRRPEHPGSTAEETLAQSVAVIRADHADFEPEIDWERLASIDP
jgi:hypothetical protein